MHTIRIPYYGQKIHSVNPSMRIHHHHLAPLAKIISNFMLPGLPVLLSGPMGVGKSTLVREILRTRMPHLTAIPSPSFPLIIPYESSQGTLWHMDLYRIDHPEDLMPLGLEEILYTDYSLIEWPERLGTFTPPSHISLSLAFTPEALDHPTYSKALEKEGGQKVGENTLGENMWDSEVDSEAREENLWRNLSIHGTAACTQALGSALENLMYGIYGDLGKAKEGKKLYNISAVG